MSAASAGKQPEVTDRRSSDGGNRNSRKRDEGQNYDLITVTHLCLEHVWRLEQYAQDAAGDGDQELGSLFRKMQEHSRKGAEECKRLLAKRLSEDSQR